MNPYKFYNIEKELKRGDIICMLVPLISSPKYDKDGKLLVCSSDIDDDDEDEMEIEEAKSNRVETWPKTTLLSTTLDYVLDTILREIGLRTRLMLEKIRIRTVSFYRCKKDGEGFHKLNSPNTLLFESKSFSDINPKFELVSTVQCLLETFVPFAANHRRFFNFYESAEVYNSLKSFHQWTLEQQLATMIYGIAGQPAAASVALISLVCKTNRNCFSHFETHKTLKKIQSVKEKSINVSDEVLSYCFYKVQNHILVLFGLVGSDEFVRMRLSEIHKHIVEYSVIHIVYPKSLELRSPQLMEWTKIDEKNTPTEAKEEVDFLLKNNWEQRSFLYSKTKPSIVFGETIRITK